MARIGEGDARWIVRDRADGTNVNAWHWTTKNVTKQATGRLEDALTNAAFPPPNHLVKLASADVSGDASINNRKGRTFLIYEFEVSRTHLGAHACARGAPPRRTILSEADALRR